MSNEKLINDFIEDFQLNKKKEITTISTNNLLQLKSAGYSVEDLLNHMSKKYEVLFHGSRTNISDEYLKQNEKGEVYSSDLAAIALMRAIISNIDLKYPGLEYPYFINENNPLMVGIHGIHKDTIGEKGFVYVLNQNELFRNEPKGSWQYVSLGQDIPIIAKIAVEKTDFKYPIIDLTNNKIIKF